jgi:two-component system response regulator HydG
MAERKARVLVVDDNLEMARTVADGLTDLGYETVAAGSGRAAVDALEAKPDDALRAKPFDAVVTDLRMPNVDGLEVLAASRRLDAERPVIVMTAFSAVDTAVESIRRGAYHYLTKPFKQDELAIFLARALEDVRLRREASALKTELRARFSARSLLGTSPGMQAVRERIERVADAPAPVIVLGETGTGKGLVARALHTDSRRAGKPFVAVNCAALPEALLESELFGHVRGAFTGATTERPGLFAEADGGSLFLDEIAEMTPGLQAKLLHVLESGVVRPVGATKPRAVDVRVIAATHRNLGEAVAAGTFREDLLYRLDVVAIVIPALRDRREDIPALVEHFLEAARARYPQSQVRRLSGAALAALGRRAWPGNVRELANVVEKLVLFGRAEEIAADELPPETRRGPGDGDEPAEFRGAIVPMRELERRYAVWAVAQTGGHRGKAAEQLDVDPKTLRKWLGEADRHDGD